MSATTYHLAEVEGVVLSNDVGGEAITLVERHHLERHLGTNVNERKEKKKIKGRRKK